MENRIPLFVWITVFASLLIIAGSVAYYFVWFLPSNERLKLQLQQTKSENTKLREIELTKLSDEEKEKQRVANIKKSEVDVIVGGPSCQPFSRSNEGKRKGTKDARGLMIFDSIKDKTINDLNCYEQGYPDLSKIKAYKS